jgi:hypothetical protein
MKWLDADRAAFEASDDPAIQYAVAVMPALLEIERQNKIKTGEQLKYRPMYLQALADYKKSHGEFVYPDANLSLRITFGNVKGYAPRDGVEYVPFTTVEGVAAKETGADPFDSPKACSMRSRPSVTAGWKTSAWARCRWTSCRPGHHRRQLRLAGAGRHGKLVGLAFDGNWESVSSNWVFDPVTTRMIAVDSRYWNGSCRKWRRRRSC